MQRKEQNVSIPTCGEVDMLVLSMNTISVLKVTPARFT